MEVDQGEATTTPMPMEDMVEGTEEVATVADEEEVEAVEGEAAEDMVARGGDLGLNMCFSVYHIARRLVRKSFDVCL